MAYRLHRVVSSVFHDVCLMWNVAYSVSTNTYRLQYHLSVTLTLMCRMWKIDFSNLSGYF